MRAGATLASIVALVLAGCALPDVGPSPCLGDISDPADPPTHHDPELEARVPDTVAGEELQIQSFCANAAEADGTMVGADLLERLGVPIDDVTFAVNSPEIGGSLTVSVAAWRYRGGSEQSIRDELLAVLHGLGGETGPAVRGGKEVDEGRGGVLDGFVIYVEGDALYLLSGTDEQVDELLAGLP